MLSIVLRLLRFSARFRRSPRHKSPVSVVTTRTGVALGSGTSSPPRVRRGVVHRPANHLAWAAVALFLRGFHRD